MPQGKWIAIGASAAIVGLAAGWTWLASWALVSGLFGPHVQLSWLSWWQYLLHYREQANVARWLWISGLGASVAFLVPPVAIAALMRDKRSLHGDARFATEREVSKAGLLKGDGLIVGRFPGLLGTKLGSKYLTFGGTQHVIISAPTRSGKGVGIVIPNLLHWPESIVVLDIKRENWDITSAFRAKHGQACYLFAPGATDYRSHRWNPLGYISEDPNHRINDTQKIGSMLFPDVQGTDPIWTATPRALFLGIVLMLLEAGKRVTLGQVLRETLADGDGSKYFERVIADAEAAGRPLSLACVNALRTYTTIASDNTRAGIMTSFRSRLELWQNPLIDAVTSENDFDLRELRKRKMSIYVAVSPGDLERMPELLNLFFQQLVDLNTRELPSQNKALKYRCVLLMDEFTAIGKMSVISKGVSFIAGYGLRLMPIIQSPSQLVDVYKKEAAEVFKTNHALQIIYPPKPTETQTAKDVSEMIGYVTVKGRSLTRGIGVGSGSKQKSENVSEQRRAVLLPQEITSLKQDRAIVVAEGLRPVLGYKVRYFDDPVFMGRLQSVAPSLSGIKGIPGQAALDAAIQAGELAAAVPALDVEGHVRMVRSTNASSASGGAVAIAAGAPSSAPVQGAENAPEAVSGALEAPRAVTPADLDRLDELVFQMDFSAIHAPAQSAGRADLDAYADQLIDSAGLTPGAHAKAGHEQTLNPADARSDEEALLDVEGFDDEAFVRLGGDGQIEPIGAKPTLAASVAYGASGESARDVNELMELLEASDGPSTATK